MPKPPLAILNFYGAQNFGDPFWAQPLAELVGRVPRVSQSDITRLHKDVTTYATSATPEGSDPKADAPSENIRQAFYLNLLADGRLIQELWPHTPKDLDRIDPFLNVNKAWPPVAIVHGTNDTTVPISLSRALETKLISSGVENEFIVVPGEAHNFAARLVKGSETWFLQRKGFEFLEKVVKRSYT